MSNRDLDHLLMNYCDQYLPDDEDIDSKNINILENVEKRFNIVNGVRFKKSNDSKTSRIPFYSKESNELLEFEGNSNMFKIGDIDDVSDDDLISRRFSDNNLSDTQNNVHSSSYIYPLSPHKHLCSDIITCVESYINVFDNINMRKVLDKGEQQFSIQINIFNKKFIDNLNKSILNIFRNIAANVYAETMSTGQFRSIVRVMHNIMADINSYVVEIISNNLQTTIQDNLDNPIMISLNAFMYEPNLSQGEMMTHYETLNHNAYNVSLICCKDLGNQINGLDIRGIILQHILKIAPSKLLDDMMDFVSEFTNSFVRRLRNFDTSMENYMLRKNGALPNYFNYNQHKKIENGRSIKTIDPIDTKLDGHDRIKKSIW